MFPTDESKIDKANLKLIIDAVRSNISCMSQIVQEAEIFFKDVVISENHVEFFIVRDITICTLVLLQGTPKTGYPLT